MGTLRRNIELKARCADLERAAAAARALGAREAGEVRQVDTYFIVPGGRLKLRETEGKPAALIWYARADSADFRGSDYHLLPIPAPSETKDALSRALGVRGEIRKRRQLLLWHNVRIHLDDVEGLGTFVEFEAVIGADADERASMARLRTLRAAMAVGEDDAVAGSYIDLRDRNAGSG